MLTPAEYHDLKLVLLMDKCHTHGEEDECDAGCDMIDRAIETAWLFSEMAKKGTA